MNRDLAIHIKLYALEAISKLSEILTSEINSCPAEEYEEIKKRVGLSIGQIQMQLLEVIYKKFPDMDDLN